MTDLREILARRIEMAGPMTVADFMADALLHPEHGYYATRDPFGEDGDFTTAPEISQMFGELVGLAIADAWVAQGRPPRLVLAELGPGRGTLMKDLMRAVRAVPGFLEAAEVHFVEQSSALRQLQSEAVSGAQWCPTVADLPEDAPLFLVANEFLDALPIRQFQRVPDGWREVMVSRSDDALSFGLAPMAPLALLDHRLPDTEPDEIVEVCPALPSIVGHIAHQLSSRGGCALFIDYGGWRSRGDTLQAVRDHAYADPLKDPGHADLTAHVDFESLVTAARANGAEAWGPVPQGRWLGSLGIVQRAEVLARAMTDQKKIESHVTAFQRLTAPDQMGTLFKVMALTARGAPRPAGFDAPADPAAPAHAAGPVEGPRSGS